MVDVYEFPTQGSQGLGLCLGRDGHHGGRPLRTNQGMSALPAPDHPRLQ